MKLSKALKQKNRLVRKINSLQQLINRDNSTLEKDYNEEVISGRFAEYYTSVNELVQLKSKIQQATAPIADKLLAMAELKGQANFINNLKTRQGSFKDYDGNEEVYSCYYSQNHVDEKVSEIECKIDELQDEVDEYNAITSIQ